MWHTLSCTYESIYQANKKICLYAAPSAALQKYHGLELITHFLVYEISYGSN